MSIGHHRQRDRRRRDGRKDSRVDSVDALPAEGSAEQIRFERSGISADRKSAAGVKPAARFTDFQQRQERCQTQSAGLPQDLLRRPLHHGLGFGIDIRAELEPAVPAQRCGYCARMIRMQVSLQQHQPVFRHPDQTRHSRRQLAKGGAQFGTDQSVVGVDLQVHEMGADGLVLYFDKELAQRVQTFCTDIGDA